MIFNENSIITFQTSEIALLTATYKYRDTKCYAFYRDKYNIQTKYTFVYTFNLL